MKKSLIQLALVILLPVIAIGQWSSDPGSNLKIAGLPTWDRNTKMVKDGQGNLYISYFSEHSELGQNDMRLAKVDPDGNHLWEADGILISSHPSLPYSFEYSLIVDPQGFLYLVLNDIRFDPMNGYCNIFAYKLSPDGEFLWGSDGIAVTSSAYNALFGPTAALTGEGNLVITWDEQENSSSKMRVRMQMLSPEGTKLWGEGITLGSSQDEDYSSPMPVPTGEEDFILIWHSNYGPLIGGLRDIMAQRYSPEGTPQWAAPVVVYDYGEVLAVPKYSKVFPGESGEAIICFSAGTGDYGNTETKFQLLRPDGTLVWDPIGVDISLKNHWTHEGASMAYYPEDDCIIACCIEANYFPWLGPIFTRVIGQKITMDGSRAWGDNGIEFTDSLSWYASPVVSPMGSSFLCMFNFTATEYDPCSHLVSFYADSTGAFLWPEQKITLSSACSEKGYPQLVDLDGQWVSVWADSRDKEHDVYGQNITVDGELGIMTGIDGPEDDAEGLAIFPNPSDERVTIRVSPGFSGFSTLEIVDLSGRRVRLLQGSLSEGGNEFSWDLADGSGNRVKPSVYILRCISCKQSFARKLVVR